MIIESVTKVLAEKGLQEPQLKALRSSYNTYKGLLMQPLGNIVCDKDGVRHRDGDLAARQFSTFLTDALSNNADLAITPEYSMPWETLINSVEGGITPKAGQLWVLGCESITYEALVKLQEKLRPHAEVLFEPLIPEPDKFMDPLAYVFRTRPEGENDHERLVVLVQFKTDSSGDPTNFEVDSLQCGTKVYHFGGKDTYTDLRLFSVICSDALALDKPIAQKMYDRSLVIHIQLNPSPRHAAYSQYRELLTGFQGDATEILCLNWAANVVQWKGEAAHPWKNVGGSAWYTKAHEFNAQDEPLQENHRRGLYYSWSQTLRSHALFFNYQPATFLLTATKVANVGELGVVARRIGPKLTRTCIWDPTIASWVEQDPVADGFAALVAETEASDEAQKAFIEMAEQSPFDTERALALTVGAFDRENWYTVKNLDSFQLPSSEKIHRLTFCQDTETKEFRLNRLLPTLALWDLLQDPTKLPPALRTLKGGLRLRWAIASPFQNLIAGDDQRATALYLHGKNRQEVEKLFDLASEYVRRAYLGDRDARDTAQQRVTVWYRDTTGTLKLYENPAQRFDRTGDESGVDIGRDL